MQFIIRFPEPSAPIRHWKHFLEDLRAMPDSPKVQQAIERTLQELAKRG